MVRGVVVATYVQLDGDNPFPNEEFANVVGVYCDVFCYSSHEGFREGMLRRVLVSQPYGGMHEGHVWKPRAARIDVANGEITPETVEPRDLDGDHVLVAFMDDLLTQPVIIRAVPHPRWGQGTEELDKPGHRGRLKVEDGEPDFWKHRGTFHGVDSKGNFLVDTTRAHEGEYNEGAEEPLDDADHGNVTYKVARNAKFVIEAQSPDDDEQTFLFEWDGSTDVLTVKTVESGTPTTQMELLGPDKKLSFKTGDGMEVTLDLDMAGGFDLNIDGGETLHVQNKDGDATLTLGDGAVPVAIADPYLKAQLENIISTYDDHTHMVPDGMAVQGTGNLGAPVPITNAPATAEAPTSKMDPYDSNIESGKLTIPDN